jgi:putative hydrolase of the HAD superfamily
MAEAPTLFFDIGGVILTNAWDTETRRLAADTFSLDFSEFETRHEMLKTAFETGRIGLDVYLLRAVFHRTRPFSIDEFQQYMYEQSKPLEALEWIRALASKGKCRLFSLNNESREMHEYRVRTYKLHQVFDGFCASCYLGQAKPDAGIYAAAIGIAGCARTRAVIVDDRSMNVEAAEAAGFQAIKYEGLEKLKSTLRETYGVEA